MKNINQNFIKILDVVRSHKHYYLLESQLLRKHMDIYIIQNMLEQDRYFIDFQQRRLFITRMKLFNILSLLNSSPLFSRQTNVGQTKMENRAYYAHNKAQEGESLVRRSTRVRNKACEFKND
ncbi:hypothetical protein H5410_000894 [Solanum commersonii]|uniref:Uncharacterized protein n=1 Tax=Solanum commersonii TaxID=4109 RepID=A0A9J6AXR5_SOLCO|nr:hypothetical protein H5410_000894 [Solanum commersonii]